jgi:two-component system chemotaxis response regulator CheB
MAGHDIIVVGASLGGVETLSKLVSGLPHDLPAAVFVVLHVPAESPSALSWLLDRAGPLPASGATDGEAIRPGRIYVAQPDHHLLVKQGYVRVIRGPRENRHRPAIDPLFRSAAASYTSRVVGVVLTGLLDDGTAGLLAIKKCGGVAVVQDPKDALYPDMPRSALANVDVDFTLPLAEIPPLLAQLSTTPVTSSPSVPPEVIAEANASEMIMSDMRDSTNAGTPAALTCPECGGPLFDLTDDRVQRYRCITGHSFTSRSLSAAQDQTLEATLWTALRVLEERASLLEKMAKHEQELGRELSGQAYQEQADEAMRQARTMRDWLSRESLLRSP